MIFPDRSVTQSIRNNHFHNRKKRKYKLLLSQGFKCQYCKTPFPVNLTDQYTIDHILPISKGGDNNKWNLQLLCLECNQNKGQQLPWQFEESISYIREGGYDRFYEMYFRFLNKYVKFEEE